MTRNIIIAVLPLLAWVGAAPAHAGPSQTTYRVSGRVQSSCSLGSNPAPLRLATTVGKDGKLNTTQLQGTTITLGNAMCSAPSSIVVRATSLRLSTPQTTIPNGQSQTVNFTATATGWSTTAASVTTSDAAALGTMTSYSGAARAQNSAKLANITVGFSNFSVVTGANGNGQKLIDGAYAATITISLTPSS